jgi:hypothetical protein
VQVIQLCGNQTNVLQKQNFVGLLCKYFRLNINLDTFMVITARQKMGFMEKIKCINYDIQNVESFILLLVSL